MRPLVPTLCGGRFEHAPDILRPRGVSRITAATTAALVAAGIPHAALFRQTPRNRTRTLVMGVLRGVESLSAADIAGYLGTSPGTVITAARRLGGRASRDPHVGQLVLMMLVAALGALKISGELGS